MLRYRCSYKTCVYIDCIYHGNRHIYSIIKCLTLCYALSVIPFYFYFFWQDDSDKCLFADRFVLMMNKRQDIRSYLLREQAYQESLNLKRRNEKEISISSEEAASAVLDYVCAYGHLPDETNSDNPLNQSSIPPTATAISTNNGQHKLFSSCSRTSSLCHIRDEFMDHEQFDKLKRDVFAHPRYRPPYSLFLCLENS